MRGTNVANDQTQQRENSARGSNVTNSQKEHRKNSARDTNINNKTEHKQNSARDTNVTINDTVVHRVQIFLWSVWLFS